VVGRKTSLSNVLSLPLSEERVMIGEYTIDQELERKAEAIARTSYPDLVIITTHQAKRYIPLQQLALLDQKVTKERDAAYRQGFDAGRQTGHEAGLNIGQAEAKQVVGSLSGLIADVTCQRALILEEAKDKILEMVLKISRKMTFAAAKIDPNLTVAIIAGAIEQLLDKSKIIIKVHPDHLAVVEQNIDRFRGDDTTIKEFSIESDPRVRTGGCFIETPSGDIDARLESMHDVISQSILESGEKAE
jgi:flagellar assembly protein FliH